MGPSPEQYEALVRAEYRWLREQLGLSEVPLVFKFDDADESPPRYGGSPRHYKLPVTSNDRAAVWDPVPTTEFPTDWRDGAWNAWRVILWHEVAHQLQDEHDQLVWDPKDGKNGHAEPGWSRTVDVFARAVKCRDPRDLYEILGSNDTTQYVPETSK